MNIHSGCVVAVLAQNKDTVFRRIGEIVVRQPQLVKGAEHAVGFHTAQFAFFDLFQAVLMPVINRCARQRGRHIIAHGKILRAGNDLVILVFAHVHAADP